MDYKNDPSADGMQAEAAKGTPAERVQAVIADEASTSNESFTTLIGIIGSLVKETQKLVRSIVFITMLIGVALIYLIVRGN